jgi:hypothetical protein
MKRQVLPISFLMVLLVMSSCQDKTRDDAKFLGHYQTTLNKTDINTSYETIDVTIDENDPEYPYLVTSTHHVEWLIDSFYGKKIDKKIENYVNARQNCQLKEGILVSRTTVKPEIKFEIVEKEGKFIKFILALNHTKPYIGTIKK